MSRSVLLLAVLVALIVLVFRRPRHDRECPASDTGAHDFMNVRDARGWRLACLQCGCRTPGWAVFPRQAGK